MKLVDLLSPAARKVVYRVLATVNAVLAILAVVPGVPFDVPTVIAVVAAVAGAAGFELAAHHVPTPTDPEV